MQDAEIKRCRSCILPENYPGLSFNEEGICRFCMDHEKTKKIKYLGDEALKNLIHSYLKKKIDRNEDYDCVVGFSGGRDSSYLLYYLSKVLNLNVLAYSADNGFLPEETKSNREKIADKLGVKLVVEDHHYLRKCLKHHLNAWIHKPSPAMISMLCTGCRLGLDIGLLRFAKTMKVPVLIWGGTPFEGMDFKPRLMKRGLRDTKDDSLVLRYTAQILKNPRWILSPSCLWIQLKEFYIHHYAKRKFYRRKAKKAGILWISPYFTHIKWVEKEILSVLKRELYWETTSDVESTWRGDCHVAILRNYLYKKMLGFNDNDDHLSCLIRDGQLTRDQALERIRIEGSVKEELIEEMMNNPGVKYQRFRIAVEKFCNQIT